MHPSSVLVSPCEARGRLPKLGDGRQDLRGWAELPSCGCHQIGNAGAKNVLPRKNYFSPNALFVYLENVYFYLQVVLRFIFFTYIIIFFPKERNLCSTLG